MAKKATKKKAKAPEYTFDDVEALADDINNQGLFDDLVEYAEDATLEEVVEVIKEVIMDGDECQIFNTDGLAAESFVTLELIGCPAVSEKTEEEEPEEEPEEEDVEPEDDVEEEAEEEEAEEKPAKKAKKVAKKAAPKKAGKKEKAAPKEKKEPAIQFSFRSRSQAIADAMKKIGTYDIDEIALEANKIFIENGGKDSMAQSIYFTRKLVAFAKEFNLAD